MLFDGYVKYEEAEVNRSAIMQDFGDNKKKKKKWPTGSHFRFYNCKLCHGLSLCEQQMLEEVSGTGMLWPLLIIFLHRDHFLIAHVHCPMRKFWRTLSSLFGQNNVVSLRIKIPGEGCTSLPRVKKG